MFYKRKRTTISKIMMGISLAAGAAIIGTGVYAGYLYKKTDDAIQRIAAPAAAAAQPAAAPEKQEEPVSIKPMIFLLAGVDSRAGGGGVMNTDVLMLVSFNPDTQSASFLSLPRDLLLTPESLPAHKANYYYAHYYIKDKASAISNTKDFFSNLLGLPINHMVVVNFNMLQETVDLLGGLTIDVDMNMKYRDTADGTNIDLKKGLQQLDGKQVLDFVRYRKSNQGTGESSDFERNDRQQQVIKQILDKMGNLQGMSHWADILDIIGENVKTDIPRADLQQWLFNFPKLKPQLIHSLQVGSHWKSPYVYMDKDDLGQALTALVNEAEAGTGSSINLENVGTADYSRDE
ncbi:LCP family protein [Paenibacillus sp. MMS20-IR301]|uniref:LCP family protein n=1 Tax=Paenibacillus sp. MMS20-IR301 TaxID=2895946 RepID=UPI0028E6B391|nr:LCP family protein [Paenibacillus sp. MMS20-IR301]WNS45460.1 LCP family protein [Paenibacillus sp. MMS20-IR301]